MFIISQLENTRTFRKNHISNSREKPGSPLDDCRAGEDNSLRVLPLYADCSLVLCNEVMLAQLKQSRASRRILQAIWKAQKRPGAGPTELPSIELRDFIQVAKEFWRQQATLAGTQSNEPGGPYFFGFSKGTNPEALVCMFLEWLRVQRALPRETEVSIDRTARWKQALLKFARIYLPPQRRTALPTTDKTFRNCLFFHTWHSLIYGEGLGNHWPVQVSPQWQSTRGGWCWGVVNNGMGGKTATDVLRYVVLDESMNAFRIAQRVGIPPRKAFCLDTGEPSVYNLGLMRHIVEEQSWSRTGVVNYPRISSFLYTLFYQFLSELDRMGAASANNLVQLNTWLEAMLNETRGNWPVPEDNLAPRSVGHGLTNCSGVHQGCEERRIA